MDACPSSLIDNIIIVCVCIDSSDAFVILLPLLLLLLLLFDGSIIKFVPKRTRRGRSDNSAAAAQRHGQALSGRLSAARRRRPAMIIIITWSVWRVARIRGFGTWHVFSILFWLVVIRGVVRLRYYIIIMLHCRARTDDAAASLQFIEIRIAVVGTYDIRFVKYFRRAPKKLHLVFF